MSKPNGPADLGASASQSPVRRAAAGNGSAGRLIMNLGTSIVIKGDLIASEDLTIYGKMEGSVPTAATRSRSAVTPTSGPRSMPKRSSSKAR